MASYLENDHLVLRRRARLICLFSLPLFFLALTVFTTPLPPWQQSERRETGVKSSEVGAIKANLQARYRKVESVTVEPSPAGSNAVLFFVSGDLRPPEGQLSKLGNQVVERDPESNAMLFVRNEAEFLGMTQPDEELRQRRKLEEEDAKVHIFFDKYIAGLRVDGMDVRVHINPDGWVFAFNGELVNMSPSVKSAVAAAARSTHISEEGARTAIADDIRTGVPFAMKIEKVAIPTTPYVVWKADVTLRNELQRWSYTIDGFTGQILSRVQR